MYTTHRQWMSAIVALAPVAQWRPLRSGALGAPCAQCSGNEIGAVCAFDGKRSRCRPER